MNDHWKSTALFVIGIVVGFIACLAFIRPVAAEGIDVTFVPLSQSVSKAESETLEMRAKEEASIPGDIRSTVAVPLDPLAAFPEAEWPMDTGNRANVAPAASSATVGTFSQLTEGEVREVLKAAGWPEAVIPEALSVAWCESRWSPGALNSTGNLGLFQLWSGWLSHIGEEVARWRDPIVNAKAALGAYHYAGDTWRQWVCQPGGMEDWR
jgi:hypothetical protein